MRLALTLALAASTLTACGEPARGAPSASPDLAAPVIGPSTAPAGSLETGPEAALAAVSKVARRYYAALDHLRRRMQAAPLAAVIAPECPCRVQVRAIKAAIRHGERYTDRVQVLTLIAHLDRPDLADVEVSLDVRHAGLVDANGHRLGPIATARNLHRELMLRLAGGQWLITRVMAV